MKRDLDIVVSDIQSAKGPSLLLLFGDDFQVQMARNRILDSLVPPSHREFNLERFDGRSTSWHQIEAALMTPPFFPGKKAVWVENAPYFLSREQKGELSVKVLQLWQDGNKDEAAKLFLDLLVLEGWTQEEWEKLQFSSATAAIGELFEGQSREAREEVEALLAHCKSQGVEINQRSGAEGHRLFELIEAGLPPWGFLLLTALQVHRRMRLYREFERLGAILDVGVERDRNGRVSRDRLAEFVTEYFRRHAKRIAPEAKEMILLRAGEELWSVHQELEKLLLFVGDETWIRARDVEMIFSDQDEAWIFDLTRAISERHATAALAHLARLLAQGEHFLRLLATIATEIRRLLSARQLLDGEIRGRWKRGMSYTQFQQQMLQGGKPLLTRNAYADYMCLQRAEKFSLHELLTHLKAIYDADLRLKSKASDPRIVLEQLILGMCLGASRPNDLRGREAVTSL